ncbi:MAG: protein phosphatase 2C domain-containing protein [Bacteroidaceae bacterium]|nr:protein phosphatase 2C domain-containing protein [Bacteroidaceae bacterium]
MKTRAFITHKQAEKNADCQDRFGVNPDTKSIAVSDGMGSSWQQKIWAKILVDTFTANNNWLPTHDNIKELCNFWRKEVVDFIQNLKKLNAPENIIIRNERNLAEGRSAGATFVGIRFEGHRWAGTVLGDSCLIEWNGQKAKFYTSQDTEEFDSYPDYFDSDASKVGKGSPRLINGTLSEGKTLFLVSDPLSDFLLEHNKKRDIAEYIFHLLSISSHEEFEILVEKWRKAGMHNDDTTLVIIENDNSDVLTISHSDAIEEMIKNEELSQTFVPQAIGKTSHPKVDSIQDKEEAMDNFVVVQNNEKDFINEFLTEYHRCLNKKFPQKKGKLKCMWTKRAVETLNLLLEKYSVTKK